MQEVSSLANLQEAKAEYQQQLGQYQQQREQQWAEQPTPELPLLRELREYIRDHANPLSFLEFFHKGTRKECDRPWWERPIPGRGRQFPRRCS
jgi:hypothetical protein